MNHLNAITDAPLWAPTSAGTPIQAINESTEAAFRGPEPGARSAALTKPSKGLVAGFWIFTALFALQMGFTAYAQLSLPQVADTFAHLGFPAYFRIELSWAKLAGLAVLLVPMVPARLKEWAYAGFAITLVSALVAHLAVGDGVAAWSWSVGTGVLWGGSYYFYRRLQARAAAA